MQKIFGLVAALMMVAVLVVLTMARGEQAQAVTCTTTVTAPDSIQTAVDAASPGNVVCLSTGTYSQSVVFGSEDSGITLSAADGASPVLDGTGPADSGTTLLVDAIQLLDGVSNVTIDGLEIRDYDSGIGNGQGNAIVAWDVSTSNVTIRDNVMHDFSWNAVLVGSEGGFVHDNWMVKNNTVTDAAYVGIELTNCENCTIMKNDVDPSLIGIVVQARNTVGGSGLVTIDGVSVLHNTVDSATYAGIYVLSFTGHPTNFSPITGASSLLSSVNIKMNTVTGSGSVGIKFWAYNNAATAINGRITHNVIECQATAGIQVLESGAGQTGTAENVKVVNNMVGSGCSPAYTDQGDDTKLPPGLGPYPGIP